MSRIGKKPVLIPNGVTVNVNNRTVTVKGPKGELTIELRPEVSVSVEENILKVEQAKESRKTSAYLGLTRSLVANMVEGVVSGFEKKLELVGVGYRVKQTNPQQISISVGYSHPVDFVAPKDITLEVADNTNITVKGVDKQKVGLIAANIRKIRKPEPYKGKGIKYAGEFIRRKQGKSGKA